MSSIKKVLCLKAKNEGLKTFTTGMTYDVVQGTGADDDAMWVYDNLGRKTFIMLSYPCIHGEWQPLEEYMCMTNGYRPSVKKGDILFGYETSGVLNCPISNYVFGCLNGQFKKSSEMNDGSKPRHEVRHVIYDTKDNKIVNDAMGECYITLAEAQEVCDEMNAPKVMKPKYTKEVEYFGMKILVPDDAKWLATGPSGVVLGSETKMELSPCGWFHKRKVYNVCVLDLNGIDWKDTLVEIK